MENNLEKHIDSLDLKIISFMKKYSLPMARWAIFVVYFWFGILKVFGLSPANPLVGSLLEKTLGLPFNTFILWFGIFEIIIAIVFIIKGLERVAFFLLIVHLITTVLPLFVLRATTWQSLLVPTLEGQYIIKNVLVVACAMSIVAHLHSLRTKTQ